MQSLNTYRLYELGAKLHSMFSCPSQNRVTDMFLPLTEAQAMLDSAIKGEYLALDTSKADATRLLNKIAELFNRYFIDPATKQLKPVTGEDRVDPHELSLIQTLLEKFEHALAAELGRMPTYVASKRGIYSIYELAEHAERVFSDALSPYIPTAAQEEFNTGGRALAFGLGTASVLHVIRATEIMLRAYYEACGGVALGKNERNFSMYLKKLAALAEDDDSALRPDKRVVQMLTQIKDNYRSPLLSVENTLSADEAMQVFGMASGIIALMAEQIKARSAAPTPKTASKNTKDSNKDTAATQAADKNTKPQDIEFPPTSIENEVYDFPLSQAG